MKKILIAVIGLSAVVIPAVSLAAGVNLINGGFGQIASNPQRFGIAVCNAGKTVVNQTVPVSVAVGGQSVTITSATPINAGACTYSYLTYSQLNMQAGAPYSVTVTIDPARTIIANKNNQTVYNITVPKAPAASPATNPAANQTANASAQSGNFFTMLGNWLMGLFGK